MTRHPHTERSRAHNFKASLGLHGHETSPQIPHSMKMGTAETHLMRPARILPLLLGAVLPKRDRQPCLKFGTAVPAHATHEVKSVIWHPARGAFSGCSRSDVPARGQGATCEGRGSGAGGGLVHARQHAEVCGEEHVRGAARQKVAGAVYCAAADLQQVVQHSHARVTSSPRFCTKLKFLVVDGWQLRVATHPLQNRQMIRNVGCKQRCQADKTHSFLPAAFTSVRKCLTAGCKQHCVWQANRLDTHISTACTSATRGLSTTHLHAAQCLARRQTRQPPSSSLAHQHAHERRVGAGQHVVWQRIRVHGGQTID